MGPGALGDGTERRQSPVSARESGPDRIVERKGASRVARRVGERRNSEHGGRVDVAALCAAGKARSGRADHGFRYRAFGQRVRRAGIRSLQSDLQLPAIPALSGCQRLQRCSRTVRRMYLWLRGGDVHAARRVTGAGSDTALLPEHSLALRVAHSRDARRSATAHGLRAP